MRAKMSWPRSSVPNGWLAVGVLRRALKSMSLIWTRQTSGPKATSTTISARTTRPSTASRCRLKRRHASAHGETLRRGSAGAVCASGSAVADAGVEPAIEEVGDQVERDHEASEDEGDRHHDRRVVALDRVDQERADAGHAEDLLGYDGAAEDLRHRQRDERHDRNHRVADDVLEEHRSLAQPLAA